MNTNMKPDFMAITAKVIAEVRNSTCIDDADVEILEGLLKDELNGYYKRIDDYYEEEYYNAISSARNSAYDNGYADGYNEGYDEGYDEGRSESH